MSIPLKAGNLAQIDAKNRFIGTGLESSGQRTGLGGRYPIVSTRTCPKADAQGVSVIASVAFDIFAVRWILSQLNGLPSMARFTVLARTSEKSWR